MLFLFMVTKNLNKDMKFFSHFSLQFKNIILILHRQKQIMGYGVMVTLQILVLSFLVRIQVAQLKRLSFRGSFFCVFGKRVVVPTTAVCGASAIDASIRPTHHLRTASLHLLPYATFSRILYHLTLTCRWLSRYDRGLLLGQSPALFL